MAITADVKNQLFKPGTSCSGGHELIRLPSEATISSPSSSDGEKLSPSNTNGRAWTVDEHNRFLEGLELFPSGPWKEIAAHVGSRTTRQTMTHAQKYREKIARRKRGLRVTTKDTRSMKRRREQKSSRKTVEVVSPCSVTDPRMNLTLDPTKRNFVDSIEFQGCFPAVATTQYQFYGVTPDVGAASSNFGSLLSDFDPLPMSEEEIDLILEAAMVPAPVLQTYNSQTEFVL
ncbi:hypothetical protein PHYBOEH_009619 [Phytophthora boehmeriae]|uniref:Myb-like DNA-binding protein n=1 Tax=Phytophthora boehmeriae TaxID=109152 RepID=A0A8T1X5K5_9STRA|nr:hypothetical protein PHYBOEH_009619 [Phytophthora boehmeriae]